MARGKPFQPRAHRRLWWGALIGAFVLSLLPTRWLLGWSSEISGLVNFPLRPFEHVASSVRDWLRPLPNALAAKPEEIQRLTRELELDRTMRKQVEVERDALLKRIDILEKTKYHSRAGDRTHMLDARVIATEAPSARSVGALVVNVGERNGATKGMVATWEGDIVVGRLEVEPGRFASLVTPVTALSGVEVFFCPPDGDCDPARAAGGVLTASRDGTWTVDLTNLSDVGVKWVARINDERWPLAVWGMRIGAVDRIGTRDDAPLVRRLIVRPLIEDPFRVPHVVLVDDSTDEGGAP